MGTISESRKYTKICPNTLLVTIKLKLKAHLDTDWRVVSHITKELTRYKCQEVDTCQETYEHTWKDT